MPTILFRLCLTDLIPASQSPPKLGEYGGVECQSGKYRGRDQLVVRLLITYWRQRNLFPCRYTYVKLFFGDQYIEIC